MYNFELFTWQYFGRDARFFSDLSHNFAGYVINTAGLEDKGCRSQIAGWLQAENFESSVWKSAEVVPVRILGSQTRFACFDSTKINEPIVYVFMVPLTDNRQ